MNAGANGAETCDALASVDFVDESGKLETLMRQDLAFSYRHSPFQHRGGAIVGATFALKASDDARKVQIEIVNKRKQTQPYGAKSAGCVFLNPSCGHAGALIDKCGLKGTNVGGAQVSDVHANFLINAGDATCADMEALIRLVKQKVVEQTGVELQSEVRRIPYRKEEI
jgi:UDP-N-acetylmuramate dehydrogenase